MQVINAALALAAKPQSKLAQENMELFKEQWEKQVRVLTDAVDDITSIDDFLAVSGNGGVWETVSSLSVFLETSGIHVVWSPWLLEGAVLVHFTWQALSSAECDVKIEQEILAQGEKVFFQVWKQQ